MTIHGPFRTTCSCGTPRAQQLHVILNKLGQQIRPQFLDNKAERHLAASSYPFTPLFIDAHHRARAWEAEKGLELGHVLCHVLVPLLSFPLNIVIYLSKLQRCLARC